jgi:hypothetical protein
MFEVPGSRLRELADDAKVASATAEVLRQALLAIAQNAHVHVWDILDIKRVNPAGRPAHPRMVQATETIVLIRCRGCLLPETVNLDGDWTEEQIRKGVESEGKE